MLIFYDEKHKRHAPVGEIFGGQMITPFESPDRMDQVLRHLQQIEIGEIKTPRDFGIVPIKRTHDGDYVDFLESCWPEWNSAGFEGEAIATVMPSHRTGRHCPEFIEGKIGYYAYSGEAAITAGTWEAATASANTALDATDAVLRGAQSSFALCRPPGHHCMKAQYGGYCYLNNAAIAAQYLRDNGSSRVAILDIDFHHGNGTQDIFYDRNDVLYCSLHGDPNYAFPFYLGYDDETGSGEGQGFNYNYPLVKGAGFREWNKALLDAISRIGDFHADSLVVSLGVDAYGGDPQSFFDIASDDFVRIGESIAATELPTVLVMEGGYAVEDIGINVGKVLSAFVI